MEEYDILEEPASQNARDNNANVLATPGVGQHLKPNFELDVK